MDLVEVPSLCTGAFGVDGYLHKLKDETVLITPQSAPATWPDLLFHGPHMKQQNAIRDAISENELFAL